MLKLYGSARSRASIIQWYLEELVIPYDYIKLDMQSGEHLQPAFLAINPFGKVPAIEDGNLKLWESGAILLYLADHYDPAITTAEHRAIVAQWVLFANATLGPGVFFESNREKEMPRLFSALNRILEEQPFLLGHEFGVVDIAVGSYLNYIPMMLKIGYEGYDAIATYVKTLAERPAFQKTIGAR